MATRLSLHLEATLAKCFRKKKFKLKKSRHWISQSGVDVQLNVGPWTTVQNVTLVEDKGHRLIYNAPTP
jgi:hypothetical protein